MKKKTAKYPPPSQSLGVLRETAAAEWGVPLSINVRAAKDRLSSLLEQAAQGMEIIITSDGEPKARLVPAQAKRKVFRVDRELLRSIPLRPGPSAEEIIRADRDERF